VDKPIWFSLFYLSSKPGSNFWKPHFAQFANIILDVSLFSDENFTFWSRSLICRLSCKNRSTISFCNLTCPSRNSFPCLTNRARPCLTKSSNGAGMVESASRCSALSSDISSPFRFRILTAYSLPAPGFRANVSIKAHSLCHESQSHKEEKRKKATPC